MGLVLGVTINGRLEFSTSVILVDSSVEQLVIMQRITKMGAVSSWLIFIVYNLYSSDMLRAIERPIKPFFVSVIILERFSLKEAEIPI